MYRIAKTLLITIIGLVICTSAYAKIVPENFSGIEYFYVFGPGGDALLGADDNELTLFIDVPEHAASDVLISVYDPDTGGDKDFRIDSENEWNTEVVFSVWGDELLDKKTFTTDEYNRKYYNFGPFSKDKGKNMLGFYRFKLVAKALRGDDANLFKVRILPNTAQCFGQNLTFRLAKKEGKRMYFYPEVTSGTDYITVHNYDLDKNGGKSHLYDPTSKKRYKTKDSRSGEWLSTRIPVEVSRPTRLKYIVKKGTQKPAHAGLRFTDDKDENLRVYFQRGKPYVKTRRVKRIIRKKKVPKVVYKPVRRKIVRQAKKCNEFTFDATESYDIDKQPLTFLWEFGDGKTSKEPVITHVYEKGGQYTVNLTVKDSSGLSCDSGTTSQVIKVNTAPKADFTHKRLVCVHDKVTFDASGTTDTTSSDLTYRWNFGDGTSGDGKVITKTFAKGGNYVVTLDVDDNENTVCSRDSIHKTLKVNAPPVAVAGRDIVMDLKSFEDEYRVVFDASASRDPDGDPLSYSWNFGDGKRDTGKRAVHTYQKGGRYTVNLTVDDGSGSDCSTASDMLEVRLNKAPIANAGDDKNVCLKETVTFDGSRSQTELGEKLTYAWDFGDGSTATGSVVNHKYTKGGKYRVKLTVNDGSGARYSTDIDIVEINVNSAPTAVLKGPRQACVGESVDFDASRSHDPDRDALSFLWDFGDGTTKECGSRASHVYQKGGTYTVRVTADDKRGYSCSKSTDSLKIKVNTPPVANTGPNMACCINEKTYFDGSGSRDPDGDTLTYKWDFGDGSFGEGSKVSHTYTKSGQYRVILTVDDQSGTDCNSDKASFIADVNTRPVPIIKVR